jgi:signal peptidase I
MRKINFNVIYKCILYTVYVFISINVLYILLSFGVTGYFSISSGSMYPTFERGDHGLINKLKLGPRFFDVSAARNGEHYKIWRLCGYGKLERGDIVIFNYPYQEKKDSIAMNLKTFYCKRVVAIAGDSLEIKDCYYKVLGCGGTIGVSTEQYALQSYVKSVSDKLERDGWPSWMRCAPKTDTFNWTICNMGPLYIPKKGATINLNYRNWILYRKYIEWECADKIIWNGATAMMKNKPVEQYTFKEDYCFVAGDHVINSRDSRYFGLVPEKFIVGTIAFLFT